MGRKKNTISIHQPRNLPSAQPTSQTISLQSRLRQSATKYTHLQQRYHALATRTELLLFSIIIFLIPSNLFLNLTKQNAFVHGILVDYLIPKLYVSDIFIAFLLIAWFSRSLPQTYHSLITGIRSFIPPRSQRHTSYLVVWLKSPQLLPYASLFLILSLLTSALASTNPLSSYWALIKIAEFALFAVWISRHLRPTRLIKPLQITIHFQTLIAVFQWIQQRSLLGYLFLGETSLRVNGHLAKTSFGGQIRVLPYGTTAHPNILAGFLTVSVLILLTQIHRHSLRRQLPLVIACIAGLIGILLTQSVSALLALFIGFVLIKGRHLFPQLGFAALSILSVSLILSYFFLAPESIDRRLNLAQISLRMIQSHPLLGVGPNNFTSVMDQYGQLPGTTRFIQPVHNIYLLFASEAGLVGVFLLLLIAQGVLNRHDKRTNLSIDFTIPLLALLLIGLADHYPISLQSGRLMLVLALGLAHSSLLPHNRAHFHVIHR